MFDTSVSQQRLQNHLHISLGVFSIFPCKGNNDALLDGHHSHQRNVVNMT